MLEINRGERRRCKTQDNQAMQNSVAHHPLTNARLVSDQ